MNKGYEMITNRIIEELSKGNIPWQKGWVGCADGAYNLYSKRPYGLLNQLLLKHQDAYVSFENCKKLGGRVKKGAKAEYVVSWFTKSYQKKDAEGNPALNEDGEPIFFKRMYPKPWAVYWIGDTTLERPERKVIEHDPITEAEDIIGAYVARERRLIFRNDQPSNKAYYAPLLDTVVVPMLSQFTNAEEYYSTAFHELTHSTGAKHRLNRLKVTELAAFGSEDYSKEELVAELGAAMLVNKCGIETERSFRNSAAYIQSWIKALKDDKTLIAIAAQRAEKAVEYIISGGKENE